MWLEFQDVSCGYGTGGPVVRGASFRITFGLWVLTGPNGSGKSTILRCAAGLLRPSRGRVLLNECDGYIDGARYRWRLGYAPQETGGYPDLSVRNYLTYLAALKGIKTQYWSERVQAVLGFVGMSAVASEKVADLSGGYRTRLGIAQAMLNDPDLLLLDEPTAGLDLEERNWFLDQLLELARNRIILMASNLATGTGGPWDGVINICDGQLQGSLNIR